MPQELPIACTLSGPDLSERLAEIREIGREALEAISLTIEGPAGAEPVVEELAGAFAG